MSNFVIKPIETAEEYAEAVHLAAETFSNGDHQAYKMIVASGTRAQERVGFTYRDRWILVADGRIVSHAIFETYPWQYGSAQIKMVGLGAVATVLRYRGMGYNAALLHDCMQRFQQEGLAPIAMLNGIGNYYHRFSFVPVIPDYMIEISAQDASAQPSPLEVRPATLADQAGMQALYDCVWPERRPTLARTAALWGWRLGEGAPRSTLVAVDAAGQVHGYLSGRGPTSSVAEVVVADVEATQSLLAYSGSLYREQGESTIYWRMPPDDPLVEYVRQLCDVKVQIHYHHNAGWMGRVLNPQALLEQVAPVLQARVDGTASLSLVDDDQIEIQYAGASTRVSPNAFFQLLTGLNQAPVELRPLFGTSPAMIAPWDWF
ncbi:MAG: GNAT family N-acetyltransferase [Anaerolineae bacterium]|nr:GNAT family N-acetyltransferase [Anaerolineae bacterium]